jgi:hypothetical protein
MEKVACPMLLKVCHVISSSAVADSVTIKKTMILIEYRHSMVIKT